LQILFLPASEKRKLSSSDGSQDMRQFALKHNALRYYLSTEGERDAYLYGLMQLVGARQLSFVRQVKDLL
jgi:hypothetical protein